jgi:hypothetical protein
MFQASPKMLYQHSGLPCPKSKERRKKKINKNNHGAKLKWTYTAM